MSQCSYEPLQEHQPEPSTGLQAHLADRDPALINSTQAQRGLTSLTTFSRGLAPNGATPSSTNNTADFTVEKALYALYGTGLHQTKIQVLGVLAYCLGSQALNMMPFLQLYPALMCHDSSGNLAQCSREEACSDQLGFEIDWSQPASLHNWMTELGLICADPAKIGIMGTIAFISIGIGSITLGGLMDQIGRKKVLLGTLIVTPCVQLMWLLAPSLLTIYFGLFLIGLCYSVRASAAYVYTTESLLSAAKLQFCVYQFMTDGLMQTTMAFLYWSGLMTWRRMVALNMGATLTLIALLAFFMCDSPQYLYSKGKFVELKQCLSNIATRNGIRGNEAQVDSLIVRLKAAKVRADERAEESQQSTSVCANLVFMCKNATLRGNLIAMCSIWAVSGFCFYLIDFYVKYFPGSVFFNKGFFGICDALSIFYAQLLESKVKKVPLVLRITLINIVLFSLLYQPIAQGALILVPLEIGMTRMQISAILAYSYHVNQYLFPTLQRGAAYSITNFVSRPVIGLATFITEYTANPMAIVTVFSVLNIGATLIIKQPNGRPETDHDKSQVSTFTPEPSIAGQILRLQQDKEKSCVNSDRVEAHQAWGTPLPRGSWRQRSQRLMSSFFGVQSSDQMQVERQTYRRF